MATIRIQHFGPITDSDVIEIKKNTFFIGNQGSGKSTIAKLISLMMWFEKAYNREDFSQLEFINLINKKKHFKYHSIQNYFKPDTKIEYIGDKSQIIIHPKGANKKIYDSNLREYTVPKIMYVPAERNFLSVLSGAYNVKGLPDNLFEFAEELRMVQDNIKESTLDLGIGNYKYSYDVNEGYSYIHGKDYRINITEASSGLQSYTPLFLVSQKLANFIEKISNEKKLSTLNLEQTFRLKEKLGTALATTSDPNTEIEIKKIKARYISKCFINIVEEPEQNLFPDSQWEVLKSLVEFNNVTKENKLIITTHSPYFINYLALLVKGFQLHNMKLDIETKEALENLVPSVSIINPNDLAVYELNEKNGTVTKLDNYKGIPSDENFLNDKMETINTQFDKLLDIEELCH